MSSRPCRLLLVSSALAGLSATAIACSSNSTPAARVYIDSQLSNATGLAGACGITDPVFVGIGTSHQPADDNSSQDNGTVSVSCSVTSNPDGTFNVTASAVVTGASGGSLTITTTPGHGLSKDGQQTNVHASFQKTGQRFQSDNCTVTYDDQDGVRVGVAAGRVGGTLECATVENPDQQVPNPNGMGSIQRTCHARATFRFENCTQ